MLYSVRQGSVRFNLMEEVSPPTLFLSCCNYSMDRRLKAWLAWRLLVSFLVGRLGVDVDRWLLCGLVVSVPVSRSSFPCSNHWPGGTPQCSPIGAADRTVNSVQIM